MTVKCKTSTIPGIQGTEVKMGVLSGQLLKKIQNELRLAPWHTALSLPSELCDSLLGITKNHIQWVAE